MTRQEHLLLIGMEECSEVAQRLSKALRFGMEEIQPGQSLTNRERIQVEWNDLVAMMRMAGIKTASIAAINAKQAKVEAFLTYSGECGTLSDSSITIGKIDSSIYLP
jgi:hypothetical protein